MSLPGTVDQRAVGPLLPAGTSGAADRQQERARRQRPRGYTFSMFHSPGGAGHRDARRHVQSFQPPPWTPIVPIHKRVSSPRRGPALVSRTGGTGRDHGPPFLLPKGRPEALPCHLGGKAVRCLRGAEAAPRRPRFPVTCSGLSRLVSRGSDCIYSRGARRPFYSPRAQK